MSTLAEIEKAIAQLPPAQWMEIRRWMDVHAPEAAGRDASNPPSGKLPDFLSRQRMRFGGRVLADSQALLDELRAERF